MKLKVLTLTQPWATLVALGAKKLETRSWSTRHLGSLLIHAAKGFPTRAQVLCAQEPFRTALQAYTAATLPTGVIVALVRMDGFFRIAEQTASQLTPWERAFGDYTPGRFAWDLADVRPLPTPVPARGHLGLWDWEVPPDLEKWIQQIAPPPPVQRPLL
jgi:hypothetical protein